MDDEPPRTLPQRMIAAWRILQGAPEPPFKPTVSPAVSAASSDEKPLHDAQREAATARLELEDARAQIAALRRELQGVRANQEAGLRSGISARIEGPIAEAAGSIAHIALQARLIEEGKPVAAADVVALASAVGRALRGLGLELTGNAGELAPYDPALHDPLPDCQPRPGDRIVVRVPGARLGGRLLRKSLVESPPPA